MKHTIKNMGKYHNYAMIALTPEVRKAINHHDELVSTLKYAQSVLESMHTWMRERLEDDILDEEIDFNRINKALEAVKTS